MDSAPRLYSLNLATSNGATAGGQVLVTSTSLMPLFARSCFHGLCALFLFSACLQAQDRPPLTRWWKLSLATLVAAQTADAVTSWHKRELNPLLADGDERFGVRSSVVESSLFAGVAFSEHLLPSHRRVATLANFAAAAAYGYFSWRNSRIPTPGLPR